MPESDQSNIIPNPLVAKERFEQLEVLRKAAWESIVSRRAVEWRVSIALWTLQAAFIYGLVTLKVELDEGDKIVLCLFPLALIVAHYEWMIGMFTANKIDKMEEGQLREEMARIAGYEQDVRVKQRVQKFTEERWVEFDLGKGIFTTMHVSQLLITVWFFLLSLVVIWRFPSVHKAPAMPEITVRQEMEKAAV